MIGNKADLEDSRLIRKTHGEQLMKDNDLEVFMETSAKTGLNTEELFVRAAKVLYQDYLLYKNQEHHENIVIPKKIKINNENPRDKKNGCC